MSAGVIALIAVGSTLAYAIGVGVTYAVGTYRGWPKPGDDPGTFFACALWPLVLPAVCAAMVMTRLLTAKAKRRLPVATIHKEKP